MRTHLLGCISVCLLFAVASACSSSDSGGGGSCASFRGRYEASSLTCSDGQTIPVGGATVTQTGCVATSAGDSGDTRTWNVIGNTARFTITDGGFTITCQITLGGSTASANCTTPADAGQIQCQGTTSFTPASGAGGSGGASGTGGAANGGAGTGGGTGVTMLPCLDGSTFPASGLCNGTNDCSDGFDELCGTCADGTTVIHDAFVCDGTPDCPGGDDESAQSCFACADGSGAVPIGWVCDAQMDCSDGSDEQSCP